MTCWETAHRIAQLLETKEENILDILEPSSLERKIIEILEPFSLEQTQFIMSIKYGYSSLLFIAVKNQFMFLVNYFLENCGADPNSLGWLCGKEITCLIAATILNFKNIVNILLTHGANVEIASSHDKTALHHACKAGYLKIAQLLIKHGADVNRHDSDGQTCLIASMRKSKLCQYLIYAGADVNSVTNYGETCLTLAFKSQRNTLIPVLIKCKNIDVRLKNHLDEDALHLAVKFSTENIIDRIITKGSYAVNETIKVYELQSCLDYIDNNRQRAKELWEISLILGKKPPNTPMFENRHPSEKLQEVKDYFNADDISALIFVETACGFNSMFTLTAYVRAAHKVIDDAEKYIKLCKFFFKIVRSLEDKYFFISLLQAEKLMWNYFYSDDLLQTHALKLIEMLKEYIENINTRLKLITPRERETYAFNVESFLHIVIDMFSQLNETFPDRLYLFYEPIKIIIEVDLRGLSQKSLLHLCAYLHQRIIKPIFLECRADVNSTDKYGRSVLHTLVELENPHTELFENIIDSGFDFQLVKYDDYCLPCTMKTEGVLSYPVKHITLQCLAAKTFCQEKMNRLCDVPRHLMAIINSHLYI